MATYQRFQNRADLLEYHLFYFRKVKTKGLLERGSLKQKFPVTSNTTLTTSIEKPSKDTKDEEAQQ